MTRRDRSKPARQAHPAWQWVRQTIPPLGRTIAGFACLGVLVGIWVAGFLQRSPYCRVSSMEIRVAPGQQWVVDPRIGYRLHPPVHILRADLPALAVAIRRDHPQLASVTVRRELPNRLVAYVTLRDPVGQLRGRQYYLVSADGIVLAPGASTAWPGLPVFLSPGRPAYQPGDSCATPELLQGIAVLREVQRAQALGAHRVSAVRLGDPASGASEHRAVTLVLENGLEVRTAPGDLAPRLARLSELLSGRHDEINQAQYVDLRFDDLVVGMRGAE